VDVWLNCVGRVGNVVAMPIPKNLVLLHQQALAGSEVSANYRDRMLESFPDLTVADLDAAAAKVEEPVAASSEQNIRAALQALAVNGVADILLQELSRLIADSAASASEVAGLQKMLEERPDCSLPLCRTAFISIARVQGQQLYALQRLMTLMLPYIASGNLQAHACGAVDDHG